MDSSSTSGRGEPRGLRRYVCVLFADLSKFTRLAQTVAPEIVYGIVRPLTDKLVAVVSVYDGEIQQVLGDGFMSVFGLRGARGDEVEREVHLGPAAFDRIGHRLAATTPIPARCEGIAGEVMAHRLTRRPGRAAVREAAWR